MREIKKRAKEATKIKIKKKRKEKEREGKTLLSFKSTLVL